MGRPERTNVTRQVSMSTRRELIDAVGARYRLGSKADRDHRDELKAQAVALSQARGQAENVAKKLAAMQLQLANEAAAHTRRVPRSLRRSQR